MRGNADRVKSYFRPLPVARVLLLSVSLLHLISTHIWVARWYQQFGHQPGDWFPDNFLNIPYALAFASAMLLPGRWWGNLLAASVGAWVIYSTILTGLLSASYAHGQPLFSLAVLRMWFGATYPAQPQAFLEFGLGVSIVMYVALVLYRKQWRQLV